MTENRIAMIRATLRYSKQEDVIRKLAPILSRRGLFLATRSTRTKGSAVHFEFKLADNSVTYAGMGVVREEFPYTGDDTQKVGMLIALQKINRPFKEVVDAILGGDEDQVLAQAGKVETATPQYEIRQHIAETRSGEGLDFFGDLDVDMGLDSLFAGIEKKAPKVVQSYNSGVYERPAVVSGLLELPSETDFLELAQISDDVFTIDEEVSAIEFDDMPRAAHKEERQPVRTSMDTGEFLESEVLARAERAQRNIESANVAGKSKQDSKKTQELDALLAVDKAEERAQEQRVAAQEAQSASKRGTSGTFEKNLLNRDNATLERMETLNRDGDDAGEMAVRPESRNQSSARTGAFDVPSETLLGMAPLGSEKRAPLNLAKEFGFDSFESESVEPLDGMSATPENQDVSQTIEQVTDADDDIEKTQDVEVLQDGFDASLQESDLLSSAEYPQHQARLDHYSYEGDDEDLETLGESVHEGLKTAAFVPTEDALDLDADALDLDADALDLDADALDLDADALDLDADALDLDKDLEEEGLDFDDLAQPVGEPKEKSTTTGDAFIESVLRDSQQAMQSVIRESHQAIQSVVRESSHSHARIELPEEKPETADDLFAELREDILNSSTQEAIEASGIKPAPSSQNLPRQSAEMSLSSSEYLSLNPDSDDVSPKLEDISLDALATPEEVPMEEAFMERINLMEGMPSRKERKTFDEPVVDMPSKKGGFLGRIFGK